jgi:hypothetical protein
MEAVLREPVTVDRRGAERKTGLKPCHVETNRGSVAKTFVASFVGVLIHKTVGNVGRCAWRESVSVGRMGRV